jgi:hypothetical protein
VQTLAALSVKSRSTPLMSVPSAVKAALTSVAGDVSHARIAPSSPRRNGVVYQLGRFPSGGVLLGAYDAQRRSKGR